MIKLSAFALALTIVASAAFAQGGGGGGGGSSGGGAAGSSAAGAAVSTGASNSAASALGANSVAGTTSHPTLSNALQGAPGTPNSQPNSYYAMSLGSSANQMGTIGGSNSGGNGVAASGSPVDNLSSTNTGVMAPITDPSAQSGR